MREQRNKCDAGTRIKWPRIRVLPPSLIASYISFAPLAFSDSLNVKNLVQDIQTQDLAANLVELSFVRLSARGDNFTLHDEMRRLVNKYNWPAQEKQTGLYRSELSRLAIRYYEQKIDNEPDAQLRQVYTVEMLYNKLYLDVNDGFKFFEQHFNGSLLTRGKCGSMRTEEAEKKMTKRIEVARAPAPLEEYVRQFDPL